MMVTGTHESILKRTENGASTASHFRAGPSSLVQHLHATHDRDGVADVEWLGDVHAIGEVSDHLVHRHAGVVDRTEHVGEAPDDDVGQLAGNRLQTAERKAEDELVILVGLAEDHDVHEHVCHLPCEGRR